MRTAEPLAPTDEYYVDAAPVRRLVDAARSLLAQTSDPCVLLEQLKPTFNDLLCDQTWLPPEFARPYAASGMGGGIGQYLLFRAADRTLTLFSLVIPPGAVTPVHDHLAWGLVGLYRGTQRELVYTTRGGDADTGVIDLALTDERELTAGDFYALIPPTDDIHRVTTTSPDASISIHLLGNDAGCVIRHRFEPEHGRALSFRSGYSNVACDADNEH